MPIKQLSINPFRFNYQVHYINILKFTVVRILLFICFIFTSFSILGQSTLLEEGNRWSIAESSCFSCHTSTYTVQGDSLIEDKIYTKIYRGNSLYTLMREDSIGRVYAIDYSGEEMLHYDFSLMPTDTFYHDYFSYPGYIIVYAVDSITLENGEMAKRILFDDGSSYCAVDEWISGVGSTGGLIPDGWSNIICMHKNDELTYLYSSNGKCQVNWVDNENLPTNFQFNITPNPINQEAVIQVGTLNEPWSFAIYDQEGKLIRWVQNINSSEYLFENKNLPNGIYFLQVRSSEHKSSIKKIVVSK